MNTPGDFLSLPAAEALAEGFARTVVELAGSDVDRATLATLRQAARAASLATAAGHTCVGLDELPAAAEAGPDTLRARLLASGMVGVAEGAPADPATVSPFDNGGPRGICGAASTRPPLILDPDNRLYLWRYHAVERRLAARLLAFGDLPPDPATLDLAATRLDARLGPDDPAAPDLQRRAVLRALQRRLTVIAGGPGTGKTTTVVQLLALLLERDPDFRILLAAPTGKAAARLRDAVAAGGARLPEAIRARLPAEGFTVHRLLARAAADGSALPCELLVVDEASMLDLMLADRLLGVLAPGTRLLLLGDRHQLAAVEAGAVFGEICGSAAGLPALAGSFVELRRSYRFASDTALGRLAAAARAGDAAALFASFDGHDTQLHADAGRQPDADMLDRLAAGYANYIAAAGRARTAPTPDPSPLFAALASYRVLCALREGPRGVAGLNAALARRLRDGDAPWYAGRPVLVTRNDPLLRLFNGDVGIVLPAAGGGWQVWFEDAAAPGGYRAVAPSRLPPHETALAMTVHKAQGSEFDRVALVLPVAASPVCTRELLYTGITRARRTVAVEAPAAVLEAALATPTRRHSGLAARLRESAG